MMDLFIKANGIKKDLDMVEESVFLVMEIISKEIGLKVFQDQLVELLKKMEILWKVRCRMEFFMEKG